MCALAIGATVLQLVGASHPGGLPVLLSRIEILSVVAACCISLCVPGLVGIDYSIRFIANLVAWRAGFAPAAWRRTWVVAPICALLWGSEATTRWPLRLRFALAQSEFTREAKTLLRETPIGDGDIQRVEYDRRIGSFHVEFAYVDLSRGTVNFRVDRGIVIAGFHYDPIGSRGTTGTCRLGGAWDAYDYFDSK